MENSEQKKVVKEHGLELLGQKSFKCSGVLSVDSYDEGAVCASLGDNQILIMGKGLKIKAFSEDSGNLAIEGEISGIKYQEGSATKGFIKRLFK